MPTNTKVKSLKINTLTKAQFDVAVQGGVIGANEISIITDLDESIQVSTMPTAAASNVDKVYQYIGATTSSYTNGYFYKCVSDGATPTPNYSWTRIDVQPAGGGSSLPPQAGNSGKFLTTDGTDASWANIPTEIPTQTGNSGKFLTTNGSVVSWATVDALPSQTGQSGKYLTTNGTTASWSAISQNLSDLNDTVISSATTGQVLTYDGTAGKWKNETSYAMVITDYTA